MNTVANYEAESQEIIANLPSVAIEVVNKPSLDIATDILREIASRKKVIQDKFKAPKDAAHAAHKAICAMEKELLAKVTMHEDELRKKVSAFVVSERRRIEAEQERQRQRAAEMTLIALEAEASGDTELAAEAMGLAVSEEVSTTIAPKADGVSFREIWSAEVVDMTKVPREYLIPDMAALNALAKAMKRESNIPGVKFVKTVVSSVRAK